MTRVMGRVTPRHVWKDWIAASLPLAMGPLQMRHDEFYRMTPREFLERLDGWRWRHRRHEEDMAHWVACIVQPHVKDRISASKILGRPIGDQ
jgi:hypothetical protein